MATFADHEKRLYDLTAIYQQGRFRECRERCERSLQEHRGMAPYWRIKTYCLLVGACSDWQKAEDWRQAGESVYRGFPKRERDRVDDLPLMKHLRESLDDLYAYQAEDAPSWFEENERFNAVLFGEQYRPAPTRTFVVEEDEDEDMEGQPVPQIESTVEDAADRSVAFEGMEAIERLEAVESLEEAAAIHSGESPEVDKDRSVEKRHPTMDLTLRMKKVASSALELPLSKGRDDQRDDELF